VKLRYRSNAAQAEPLDFFQRPSGLGHDLCEGSDTLSGAWGGQLDDLRLEGVCLSLKAILVGESGVGKTALLRRSCGGTFDDNYKATIGADFLTKFYTAFQVPCELNIWDTAGQERWQAATRHFFRGADVVILCFDLNDAASFEKVPEWFRRVTEEQRDGRQPLPFLVGTKADLYHEVDAARASAFATQRRMEYFETSAKDGTNVKAFLDRVVTVYMYHHLRQLHAQQQQQQSAPPGSSGARRPQSASVRLGAPATTPTTPAATGLKRCC